MICTIFLAMLIFAPQAKGAQSFRINWFDFQDAELNEEVGKAVHELTYGLSNFFRMLV